MKERKDNKRPGYRDHEWKKLNKKKYLKKKYYDTADMRVIFKVSSRTLQRWRNDGLIPFKKLGGKIYYLADKVDQIMRKDENSE